MNLPIDADVLCTDGAGGHSTAVLLNPISGQVTHLIVREPGLLGIRRMLPVDRVGESTPVIIRLNCTRAELAHMPPFVATSFLPAPAGFMPGYAGLTLWPYVSLQSEIGIEHENTPPGELAVQRGAHVHATDGPIGEVEEFLVDPANNGITHVVLREGHFWNRMDVTIPVKLIDHIADDHVYLKLDKQQIAALPAVAVQRRRTI